MFATLPTDYHDFIHWTWPQFEPYYQDLNTRSLTAETVEDWLAAWSQISKIVQEPVCAPANRHHPEHRRYRSRASLPDLLKRRESAARSGRTGTETEIARQRSGAGRF